MHIINLHKKGGLALLCTGCMIFSIAWILWGLAEPLLGDDLKYAHVAMERGTEGYAYGLAHHAWSIWCGVNARLGDMWNVAWLGWLPRPVTAVCMGAAVFSVLWNVGLLGSRSVGWRILTALGCMVLLPWWDMDFFVCHFNYIWGMALVCPALVWLLSNKKGRGIWAAAMLFSGGITHEALGFPLAAGSAVYLLFNRREWCRHRLCWCAVFMAGIFSVSSPASYARLGTGGSPDLPFLPLVLTSLPVAVLLVARIVWLSCHGETGTLLRSAWSLIAAAALVSGAFVCIGGVMGRAGYFAEAFALAALVFDFSRSHVIGRRCTMLMGTLLVGVAIFAGVWLVNESRDAQKGAGRVYNEPWVREYARQSSAQADPNPPVLVF